MERVLTRVLGDVLVGANTTCLQSLGRDLLLLVAEQVDAQGELVNTGLLTTKIVDTDLGVYSFIQQFVVPSVSSSVEDNQKWVMVVKECS